MLSIYVRDDLIDTKKTYVCADELHAIRRMNDLGNYVRTRDSFLRTPGINYQDWLQHNPQDD